MRLPTGGAAAVTEFGCVAFLQIEWGRLWRDSTHWALIFKGLALVARLQSSASP
jgi:hypothetical protein